MRTKILANEVDMKHLTKEELEVGLDEIKESPKNAGIIHLIVRRPATEEREILTEGKLDLIEGLVGDNWRTRGSSRTTNGLGHPEMQLNIMNSRVVDLVAAHDKERWQLAGDQFFIDMDLSKENLPSGTQLALGTAIVEVTPIPHAGCKKFVARFGLEAMKFVNSEVGTPLRLRGLNAKVVQPGTVKTGDVARKI
jgi:hypothetical protein